MRRIGQSTGAQINFDARSETEYGTLRGWVQLEGFGANTRTGTDITVDINRALQFRIFADNLANTAYREHASTLDGMQRNITFSLNYAF